MSLNKLIRTARKSTHSSFHHGTLILRGGAVVAAGYNHGEIHSEKMAISKLWPNKRKGCTVINVRITKTGFGNSAPCPDCLNLLRSMGIKRVIYSERNGNFREIRI